MAASTYAPRLSDGAMAEMNVTPLVDVMLVMLVIFMITAPALTRTLPMRLPVVNSATPPSPPPRIDLRVDATGRYLLDGRTLSEAGLQRELAQVARLAPDTVLHVLPTDDSEYQAFTTVLAAAHDAGLSNIAVE